MKKSRGIGVHKDDGSNKGEDEKVKYYAKVYEDGDFRRRRL